MQSSRTMRATTVRFGETLLREIGEEADRAGVSVAQYVRESVIIRIAYNAGARGPGRYESSLTRASGDTPLEVARSLKERARRSRIRPRRPRDTLVSFDAGNAGKVDARGGPSAS